MAKRIYTLPSGVQVTARGYRQWRMDMGICLRCNEPLSVRSVSLCERHLFQASNAAMGYRSATGNNGRHS